MSEIRTLIAAARQERDAANPVAGATGSSPYNPYAASAPPPMEERKEGVGFPPGCSSPEAPPSCECGSSQGGETPVVALTTFFLVGPVVVLSGQQREVGVVRVDQLLLELGVLFPADGMTVVLATQRASFRYCLVEKLPGDEYTRTLKYCLIKNVTYFQFLNDTI